LSASVAPEASAFAAAFSMRASYSAVLAKARSASPPAGAEGAAPPFVVAVAPPPCEEVAPSSLDLEAVPAAGRFVTVAVFEFWLLCGAESPRPQAACSRPRPRATRMRWLFIFFEGS
jgi:hypothetical protein